MAHEPGQGLIPLTNVAEALALSDTFQEMFTNSDALQKVREICVDFGLPKGKTMVPLHAWISKAGAREWVTDPAQADRIARVGGTWHTKWYETTYQFHQDEIDLDKIGFNQIDRLKNSIVNDHASEIVRQVADLINNGTTVADYPAYIDEASTTKAFFADDHEYGGATWDNYEDTNTVTAAQAINTNLDNLKAAFAAFVQAPDFKGLAAGYGNDYSNISVLYAPNLVNVIHTLMNDPAVYAGGTSYHNDLMGSFDATLVPGMTDDTICLIRRGVMRGPFVFAHSDPWETEAWRSPGSPWHFTQLRWRWLLIPADPRAAYYVG